MGEGQRRQRAVADEARGAAGGAAPDADIQIAQAIPAEAARPVERWRAARSRHVALPMRVAQHLPGCGNVGRMQFRGRGKGLHGGVIAHHEIEHAEQEIAGRRRQSAASPGRRLFRPGTGPAARDRRQRRTAPESQRFQRLREGCEQAFSRDRFAFPLTYGVYFGAIMPEFAERCSSNWKPHRKKTAPRV